MRLSLRFLLPLMLVVGLFAYAAVPLADTLMLRWFVRDLDTRSSLIASAVSEPLSGLVLTGSTPRDCASPGARCRSPPPGFRRTSPVRRCATTPPPRGR